METNGRATRGCAGLILLAIGVIVIASVLAGWSLIFGIIVGGAGLLLMRSAGDKSNGGPKAA